MAYDIIGDIHGQAGKGNVWVVIAGIEAMHRIRKEQTKCLAGQPISAANHFYRLAA